MSRTEALACAREAVEIRRALAETQPAAYRPDLAMSLNNLATHLSEQGDAASRTEALACAREAVQVYRALAEAQPAAYRPNLAASLNNLVTNVNYFYRLAATILAGPECCSSSPFSVLRLLLSKS